MKELNKLLGSMDGKHGKKKKGKGKKKGKKSEKDQMD